ncbi:hypothetical protein AYX14_04222 [Cryptococcus neoformans]|nr:hypothetical protein AYX15_05039 [Cryptococcus neoformans var. grubii]OWZ70394.1 hypothetical protein AYX14_04222 [Cryptococcus neoformans var. grubii]
MPAILRRRFIRPLIVFILLTLGFSTYRVIHPSLPPVQLSLPAFKDPVPLITLVIIYNGLKFPPLTAYFWQSVGRQPHALEFVFIQRGGCSDLSEWTHKYHNIKHVCLSEEQFWGAHRDYLCKRWGRCARSQRNVMLQDMVTLGTFSTPQAVYPILRGWVFKKYINPKSVWWGYCDMDTFIGDLTQTFPYDLAQDDYDVLIPTHPIEPAGGPELLFMRGHMTFFRNRRETEDRLMTYSHFKDFTHWDEMPFPGVSMGEAEYSHFVVGHPDINILTFDAMAPAPYLRSSSPAGVISHPDKLRPTQNTPQALPSPLLSQLMAPSIRLSTRPTFTKRGIQHNITITQGSVPTGMGIWFKPEFASWYTAQPLPEDAHKGDTNKQQWRRFLLKVNNQWKERLEPHEKFRGHLPEEPLEDAYQWLYAHWQEEKKQAHWRGLPIDVPPADIFVSYYYDGNAAFDGQTGERTHWLPKKKEDCSTYGCVEPGQAPIMQHETFQHYTSTRSAFVEWYKESKAIRMGYATGTVGPDPSKPTQLR